MAGGKKWDDRLCEQRSGIWDTVGTGPRIDIAVAIVPGEDKCLDVPRSTR